MTRDYKKQAAWQKEHRLTFSVSFAFKQDADIISYLEDKQKARISRNAIIKKALRGQMMKEGYQVIESETDIKETKEREG